jgi:hypothetical protein
VLLQFRCLRPFREKADPVESVLVLQTEDLDSALQSAAAIAIHERGGCTAVAYSKLLKNRSDWAIPRKLDLATEANDGSGALRHRASAFQRARQMRVPAQAGPGVFITLGFVVGYPTVQLGR